MPLSQVSRLQLLGDPGEPQSFSLNVEVENSTSGAALVAELSDAIISRTMGESLTRLFLMPEPGVCQIAGLVANASRIPQRTRA